MTGVVAIVIASVAGGAPNSPVRAQEAQASRLVRSQVDPDTGLNVRVIETPAHHLVIEVAGAGVSMKKDVGNRQSITTIATPGETVVLAVESGHLTLRVPARRLVITGISPEAIGQLIAFMKRSPAVRAARALLARTRLAPNSFERRALELTELILRSADAHVGSPVTGRSLSPFPAGSVTRTTYAIDSCWDTYTKTADALIEELIYCSTHPSWWNPFPLETCELEYAVKAEVAFGAYVACEGGHLVG